VAHAKPSRNLALASFTRSRLGTRPEKEMPANQRDARNRLAPIDSFNSTKVTAAWLHACPRGRVFARTRHREAQVCWAADHSTRDRHSYCAAPLRTTHEHWAVAFQGRQSPRREKTVLMIIVLPWGHAVPFGGPGYNNGTFERYLAKEVVAKPSSTIRPAPTPNSNGSGSAAVG